jgi:hypothetical protein
MAAKQGTTDAKTRESEASQALGEFLHRVLELVSAFEAIKRLSNDHEIDFVAERGCEFAHKLADDLDKFEINRFRAAQEASNG